jgi:NRPS condensation-like uncharacterized protein
MTTPAGTRAAVRHVEPPAAHRTFGIVDELNCYFDAPAEPNNVHVEIWLPGHLHPDRLRTGVTAMLGDQPRAGIRRAERGWWHRGYAWEFPPQADVDPVSTTHWRTEADLDDARARFLATAPPLDRAPPFRLLLARGPGQDSLILNAHHAAFDGRSCLRLLRLIADQYNAGAGPAEPPARPQPPGEQYPGTRQSASRLPGYHAPAGRSLPRAGRTARIAPRHAGGRRPRRAPGYGFVLLEWPGVPAPRRPGHGPRPTVNDLLIAALIRAILRWNASAYRRLGRVRMWPGRVRISMPADARPPGRGDELGNLSRLCTVSADPSGTAALTTVVADQTRWAKHQPGPPVAPALAAVARTPLPTSVKRHMVRLGLRCLGRLRCDTSLLSNLGNITDAPRFGALSPARMWFSTSTHMPVGLSAGAITVDGRLHVCFRYRHALFDHAAAQDFAAEYATALAALAGTEASR